MYFQLELEICYFKLEGLIICYFSWKAEICISVGRLDDINFSWKA